MDRGAASDIGLLGADYERMLDRMRTSFEVCGDGELLVLFRGHLPPGSPTQEEKPYAFKVHAMKAAIERGADVLLWADASVIAMRPLSRLWPLIEDAGVLFTESPECDCGQFTCDSALEPLGITREEAFRIPHVVGTAFGVDLRTAIGAEFFSEWSRLEKTNAFCGPKVNTNGEASADSRVLGHRWDQTAASIVAWRLGIKLSRQSDWLAECREPEETTILTVNRGE